MKIRVQHRTTRKTVAHSGRTRALARATMAMLLLISLAAAATPARSEEPPFSRPRQLAFEANRGQLDESVKFRARGAGYTVFLTSTEAVVTLDHGRAARAVVRLKPLGASAAARIVPDGDLPGVVNYARTGPGAARVSAPTFARVKYTDVYPGIDLIYYGGQSRLEYDFVVSPGADPGQIALAVGGVDRVAVDASGDLILHTEAGEGRQPRPVVYQDIDSTRRPVTGDYAVDADDIVRFRIGAYDRSRALIIDPVLLYSTYLGGFGSEGTPMGAAGIAVDAAGNAYVTGTTESVDFPTVGTAQTASGGIDIFVTKFSPSGEVIYSTYLGSPCDDTVNAIAIDPAGNAYITGRVDDTICAAATPGALVAKLDPTGGLVYASVFGGRLLDSSEGRAIAVDVGGHAYVTGVTSSSDFPVTEGSLRTEKCADDLINLSDGFVAKLKVNGTLEYSTFLCGIGDDVPSSIAIDAAGNAYVAGTTGSHDFPTVNALQPTFPNPEGGITGVTGFISKLSPDGSQLLYSTYFGGTTRDILSGMALDGQGNIYVAGFTQSLDFPTTPGVLQEHSPTDLLNLICGYDVCYLGFVAKINASGSALVYSTYLYGEADHTVSGIAVDGAGNAYVVGDTNSSFFPIRNAFQSSARGNGDAFITKLNPDGTRLVYSSYLGGSKLGAVPAASITGSDVGSAIALDSAGNAYVVGYTYSRDFPTVNAFQPNLADGGSCDVYDNPCSDAFVAKISAGGPGVVPAVSIAATPANNVPGGTVIATWAGLSPVTYLDQILLNEVGSGRNDFLGYWSTDSAASGTLSLPLPDDLPYGNYELRLITPDSYGVAEVIARTEPFHVGPAVPAAADLLVASVTTTPAQPTAGQAVAVSVTVTNQGTVPAGSFVVDFYKNRSSAPAAGVAGDVRCTIPALAPAASAPCTGTVTYPTVGTVSAWAQVDTGQSVTESNESNNVFGPQSIVVGAALADLVVVAVGNPPASAAPGATFTASDTVKNQGAGAAVSSTTRYYLSVDAAKDATDILLTGSRSVAALAAGTQSAGTATVTIPAGTVAGNYHLLACADDTGLVAEANETNNCAAAATTIAILVGGPDLVETAVTNPPATATPGTSFRVTDTVRNEGALAAGASKTRFYLSADGQKSAGDRLLAGSHAVTSLAPGATSTHTVRVTIPSTTPPGTYFLLACANDTGTATESDTGNNCRASAGAVTVALPDLVQQTVSNPGGPFQRGTAFTVSDTVVNSALVSTESATTTKYYLSHDAARSAGDTLLVGTRRVPILGASAHSSGSASVTIPSTVPAGTYFVLACADDSKALVESNEANNCLASGTTVVVTQ